MTIKINGKRFDFDSDDIYQGQKPPLSLPAAAPYIVIAIGILTAILWYNGVWHVLLDFFHWIIPNYTSYVR